jgi:dTDP-4-dehydrorhamnose 3,5-epimerase
MIYIPEGFAHGFQSLEDESELLYFHTEYYTPAMEQGIRYDDEALNITWPIPVKNVSARDLAFETIDIQHFKGLD